MIVPTEVVPVGQDAAGPEVGGDVGGEAGGDVGGEAGGEAGGEVTKTPSPGDATPSEPEQAAAVPAARQARRAARTCGLEVILVSLKDISGPKPTRTKLAGR